MFDRANNELFVGDKVMIVRCDDFPSLVGKIATVMEQDGSPKIRVSFSGQWQGYFRGVDIIKYSVKELKVKDTNVNRNAEYFRKLQNVKPIEEQVQENVTDVLNNIENYIKNGGKKQYLSFEFNVTEKHGQLLILELKKLGFITYSVELTTDGFFSFCLGWDK